MAVLALVIGIISFVCVWGIGGVLAIVFGILGLNRSKAMDGEGRGMSIAGIVLGIVNIIGTIAMVILFTVVLNEAAKSVDEWGGKADSSKYTLSVAECTTDSFGYPEMTVRITNLTSSSKSYTLDYVFRAGGSIVDSGTSLPVTIPANESVRYDISGSASTTASTIRCEITEVDNWFN